MYIPIPLKPGIGARCEWSRPTRPRPAPSVIPLSRIRSPIITVLAKAQMNIRPEVTWGRRWHHRADLEDYEEAGHRTGILRGAAELHEAHRALPILLLW